MSGPESSSIPTHAPGTLLGGKFRIVRLLGAGGMGAVYEIEHEITKHRRALKMLHGEVQKYPHVVARFLREASAAGRVGNPHIIETYDAGTLDTGDPYLVMEMLHGETIADIVQRKRQLGLAEMIDLVGQAADGVQAAHAAGIVHRDLKPENLFVITKDQRPFLKILDFGVSKFDPQATGSMSLTSEGSAIGTPFYMPPEQVRGGKDIDARADVYALGVILYECATGRKPFEADTLPHLALLIHEGKFEPVARRRPDLPSEFGDIVACAMAGDRDARFPTARALRDALDMLRPLAVSNASMLGETAPQLDAPLPSRAPMSVAAAMTGRPPVTSLRPAAQPLTTVPSVTLGATTAGSATPVEPGKKSGSGLVLVAIGGLAVAVIAAVGFFAFGKHRAPDEIQHLAAPSAPSAAATQSSDAITVTPVTSATTSAPPADSAPPTISTPAPPSTKGTPHGGATPPPATPPQPPTNTRADQKGLSKDNPFK